MRRTWGGCLAGVVTGALCLLAACGLQADGGWSRFRGPAGRGQAEGRPPSSWSDSQNLKWKTPLPGPGSSSPIVVGDRVLVTCYSGYGAAESAAGDGGDSGGGGSIEQLRRHLVCVDRGSGRILWQREVAAVQPEDAYQGFLTEHGYASQTPVSDGQRVFVFFGKTGALAFDLEGKQLWQASLGTESNDRRWGSAASPILYKNLVIINASDESQSLRALDQATGEEVWKAQAASLDLSFSTPALVTLPDGEVEVVLPVPGEVWGLRPDTGKLKWYCDTGLGGNISPTIQVDGDRLYVFGGFPTSGSVAIRAGGRGDVSESHVLWRSRASSYVATPLLHDGHLYWVDDRGTAHCSSAATGESVYRERLATGGGGRPFYASPVLADGKLFVVSRTQGTFVLAARPEFEKLAVNRFEADSSQFNGTPALVDDQLFLRSDRFLYCIEASR